MIFTLELGRSYKTNALLTVVWGAERGSRPILHATLGCRRGSMNMRAERWMCPGLHPSKGEGYQIGPQCIEKYSKLECNLFGRIFLMTKPMKTTPTYYGI